MADTADQRGRGRGFPRGRGRGDRGDGDRGFGRRGGRGDRGRGGRGGRGGDKEEEAWVPVTKLGRLVKSGLIKRLEEIYLFSLPVKEYQIIDFFYPPKEGKLKDEVMKIMPVQKQTRAGQRTRFKAFVIIGDHDGHVGLGVKCSKEVATAIRGGIILAKLAVIPVRRGYWGNMIGDPHTVPMKVCNTPLPLYSHYAFPLIKPIDIIHTKIVSHIHLTKTISSFIIPLTYTH